MGSVTTVYHWYWSEFGEREVEKCRVSQNRMFGSGPVRVRAQHILHWTGSVQQTERPGAWHLWSEFYLTWYSLWNTAGRTERVSLQDARLTSVQATSILTGMADLKLRQVDLSTELQWSVISVSRTGSEGNNETGNGKLGTMPSLTQSNGDSL